MTPIRNKTSIANAFTFCLCCLECVVFNWNERPFSDTYLRLISLAGSLTFTSTVKLFLFLFLPRRGDVAGIRVPFLLTENKKRKRKLLSLEDWLTRNLIEWLKRSVITRKNEEEISGFQTSGIWGTADVSLVDSLAIWHCIRQYTILWSWSCAVFW